MIINGLSEFRTGVQSTLQFLSSRTSRTYFIKSILFQDIQASMYLHWGPSSIVSNLFCFFEREWGPIYGGDAVVEELFYDKVMVKGEEMV